MGKSFLQIVKGNFLGNAKEVIAQLSYFIETKYPSEKEVLSWVKNIDIDKYKHSR